MRFSIPRHSLVMLLVKLVVTLKSANMKRLQEVQQKIPSYLSDTTKRMLRLFKSYCPKANLTPLRRCMAMDCTKERFVELLDKVKPVAAKIVKSLEQDPDTES